MIRTDQIRKKRGIGGRIIKRKEERQKEKKGHAVRQSPLAPKKRRQRIRTGEREKLYPIVKHVDTSLRGRPSIEKRERVEKVDI